MPSTDSKREKAREVVDILEEISVLLVGQRLATPRYSANCVYRRTLSWIELSCLFVFR